MNNLMEDQEEDTTVEAFSPTPSGLPSSPPPERRPNPAVAALAPREVTPQAPGLMADELRNNPQTMEDIREYMIYRKGQHMADLSDEELYDLWANHSRSFNTNEVTTVGELIWANRASEDQLAAADRAYRHWDSLGNVFSNDGVSGAADGVRDYIWAGITSPSTWVGGLLGRAATAPGRMATKQQIANIIRAPMAARTAAPVGNVATQAAIETAEQQARQVAVQAARQNAVKEMGIAIATDTTLTGVQDAIRQATLLTTGTQDRYSAIETILNSAAGLVGGMPSAISYVARQRDAVDINVRASVVAQRNAEAALEKARPEIERALEVFDGKMIDWLRSKETGLRIIDNDFDLANRAVRTLLSTDPEEQASIVNAMVRAGVTIKRGDPDVGVVEQIASFARNISPEKKAEMDLLFRKHLNGMSFDEFVDVMVASVSQAGSNLKLAKDAADALTKVISARNLADGEVVGLSQEAFRRSTDRLKETPSPDVIRYVQSIWRRALVSHPATTAVNVAGWAQVEAFKGVAEVLHGGILGTMGLAAKILSPVSAKAGKWGDKALRDSLTMIQSQVFKLRTLMSPTSTRDIFEAILDEANPKRTKQLKDSLYGGVDGTSEGYNISKNNRAVRVAEGYLNKAGQLSLLKAQDMFTKSHSFITELDKQLRLLGNTNLNAVLKAGDLSLIPEEAFEKATRATMRSVMSEDYTRGKGALSKLASFVETVSNLPIIGFIFPFGRFMNNQLAFIMQYSPLGVLPELAKMRQKGFFTNPDLMEAAGKALVGTAAFSMLVKYSQDHQEAGYAWYEITDSTGTVINVQNMAPISAYMAGARYVSGIQQGQITPELQNELIAQMGALSMMSTAQQDPIGEIVKYVNSIGDDKEEMDIFVDFLGGLAPFFTGVAAGFTRPIEPIDAVMGMVGNTDAAVDRRQLSGIEAAYRGATKYVENTLLFMENVLEEPENRQDIVSPQRQDASRFGPVRDPNPLSRLMGAREQENATNVTKLFNMVNIPIWTIQERTGIPEWDALMNDVITPRLEADSRQLMNNRLFREGNLATRERLVRNMLREVRRDTIALIETNLGVEPNILRLRQAFTRKPMSLRRQAKDDLGITTDDRELSFAELQQLQTYIDIIENREKLVRP
jgi:hypothetical protein